MSEFFDTIGKSFAGGLGGGVASGLLGGLTSLFSGGSTIDPEALIRAQADAQFEMWEKMMGTIKEQAGELSADANETIGTLQDQYENPYLEKTFKGLAPSILSKLNSAVESGTLSHTEAGDFFTGTANDFGHSPTSIIKTDDGKKRSIAEIALGYQMAGFDNTPQKWNDSLKNLFSATMGRYPSKEEYAYYGGPEGLKRWRSMDAVKDHLANNNAAYVNRNYSQLYPEHASTRMAVSGFTSLPTVDTPGYQPLPRGYNKSSKSRNTSSGSFGFDTRNPKPRGYLDFG